MSKALTTRASAVINIFGKTSLYIAMQIATNSLKLIVFFSFLLFALLNIVTDPSGSDNSDFH